MSDQNVVFEYDSPFLEDEDIVSLEDLSRMRVLSGWQVQRIRSRAWAEGFAACSGVVLLAAALGFFIAWMHGGGLKFDICADWPDNATLFSPFQKEPPCTFTSNQMEP